MSSRTISGRRTATAFTASAPLAASPTTPKPSACSSARAEARKAAWSSTMSTVGRIPLIVPHATGAHTVASTNHRDRELPGRRSASLARRRASFHRVENCGQPQPHLEATSDVSACRRTEASHWAKPAHGGGGGVPTRTDEPGSGPTLANWKEHPMRHPMKWLIAVALCAGMALPALPAQAKVPGPNGRIAFSRGDRDDNTVTYTANPDGSHLQQLFAGFSGGPRWSPDGSQVSILTACSDGEENCAATIVDPDTGTFRQFKWPDPTLETPCGGGWSPDGTRLTCESFGVTDPSRNGIYTIRASDGRGLSRITSNPGGDDIPGDYSPDGKRLVFSRVDPSRPANANVALFVVNLDGTGVRRITPWGLPFFEDGGRWSPDGSTILFDDQRSLYVVHPDGSGMAKLPLVTHSFSRLQNPDWSPDGTKIVVSLFAATAPGTGQAGIYTANADGSDLQQVTSSPTFDRTGDWGPHPLAT